MTLSFDGVDDSVPSSVTVTIGGLISFAVWIRANSQGEGDKGCIFCHGPDGANVRYRWSWDDVAGSKRLLLRGRGGVNGNVGEWRMATGFALITGWKFVAFTHDLGSNANDPIMYTYVDGVFSVLTVGSGLTELQTPSGTNNTDNKTLRIGNTDTGGATFNGVIGEFLRYNRILSEAEVRAILFLGANAVPDYVDYLPFDDGRMQQLGPGSTYDLVGAIAGDNPPAHPAGRMW